MVEPAKPESETASSTRLAACSALAGVVLLVLALHEAPGEAPLAFYGQP